MIKPLFKISHNLIISSLSSDTDTYASFLLGFREQFYFKEKKEFTPFTGRANSVSFDIAVGLPLNRDED